VYCSPRWWFVLRFIRHVFCRQELTSVGFVTNIAVGRLSLPTGEAPGLYLGSVTGIVTELCRGFSQCSFVSVGIYVKIVHYHFMPHSVHSIITACCGVVLEMGVDLKH
jgi:hypothetical protein